MPKRESRVNANGSDPIMNDSTMQKIYTEQISCKLKSFFIPYICYIHFHRVFLVKLSEDEVASDFFSNPEQ